MSNTLIPLQFVQSKFSLNWGDCLWAYKRELLTWKDLIRVALERVENGSSNELEIELANVGKDSVWKVSELAQALTQQCENSEETSKQKWLFLCLAWAYENRGKISDPLGEVEAIYADFDYPSSIESFVRFLPPLHGYDPSHFSQEQNYQHLMTQWSEFLLKKSGSK
jgi:hypothetical protein